ncbi:hypothetical protein HJD18_16080 [Thermoleophilia bacterium SCSIO 60948]|nr:hypothetical protein HJD18_16080 [Thermoleophilia bacterium SCSIO 60948]
MGRLSSVGPRLWPAVLALIVIAVVPMTASGGGRATPGALTHIRDDANCIASYLRDRCSVGVSMEGIKEIVVSNDGRSIYASGERGITILGRSPRTGAISQVKGARACVSGSRGTECTYLDGLADDGVTGMTLSPDDETLYVPRSDGTLTVLDRANDGSLSQAPGPAGCIGPDPDAVVYQGEVPYPPDEQRTCSVMEDAPQVGELSFGPDGDEGFMSYGSDPARIAAFRRTEAGGFELLRTADSCVRGTSFFGNLGPCTEVEGYGGGRSDLAPDAENLYALSGFGSPDGGAVAYAFDVDVDSNTIAPVPGLGFCASDDGLSGAGDDAVPCSDTRGLGWVRDFAVGDGAVYALADGKRLVALERGEDGSLSQRAGRSGCASTGGGGNCVDVLGMKGAMSMELTADDRSAYVSGWADDTVATIALDKDGLPTGPVTRKPPCHGGSYRSPCKDIPNVSGSIDSIAAARDGESVYMAGDEAVVGFDRGPVGRPAVAKRRMTLRLSDRPLRPGVQRIRWRVRIRSSDPECIAGQEVWARALHDGGGYGSLGPIRTNEKGRASAKGRVYGDSRVVALVHGDTTCADVRSNKVRVDVGRSR